MKTILKTISMLITVITVISCVDELADISQKETSPGEKLEMRFSASFGGDTKTTLVNGTEVWWIPYENITVNGDVFYSTNEELSPTVEFVGKTALANDYRAISSNSIFEWSEGGYFCCVNFWQWAVKNQLPYYLSTAKCVEKNGNFRFRSLLGYIKFTITEDSWPITQVRVDAPGKEALAYDRIFVDFSGDQATFSPEVLGPDGCPYPEVYLNSDTPMEPGDYYIALYPGTYSEGLRFIFNTSDSKCGIKQIRQEITLKPGYIQDIGIIENITDMKQLEREALIAFYNATGGDNWVHNDNWCSDRPLNEWYGVYTDGSGFVTSIELYIPEDSTKGNNLSGTLPPEFRNLKNLFRFRVDNCEQFLCDGFPELLLEMPNLIDLNLSGCGLTGQIPEKISRLSNLKHLNLQSNQLTGTIPASIADIRGLETLWLYGNSLEGDVPQAIQDMDLWIRDWENICDQKGTGLNPETLSIPFPDFDFTTLDGERITDDFFKDYKYTIFYHYGHQCPFSEIYTPKLVRLYNMYKDKGLGAISFGDESITTPDQMRAYVESNGITWPNVFLEFEVAHSGNKGYGQYLHSMPTVCVIDNTGKVVFNHIFDDRETLGNFLCERLGEGETDIYESVDYSADGKITMLQEAKTGNGIDVILLGDGYSDRLIADGTYDRDMKKMNDIFFSVEPYASFKDFFNVYSVVAVSKNELFDNGELLDFGAETALSGWFGYGTEVGGDDGECLRYARMAVSDERMDEALIIVSMNAHNISGTCYMYQPASMNDYGSGTSIAYFASGDVDEYTSKLVHHEAGGHGFAKLADEYAYENYGAIPDDFISSYKMVNEWFGWWKNVDFTTDPTLVKWSKFLEDERYSNEGLGIFEGALAYWTGVYRPSQNSIMKDDDGYFNAPSREAIWYRIHKLAYGDDWEYDYEDFVEYDTINRASSASAPQRARSNYVEKAFEPTPPVVVGKSWRDALD